MKWSNYLRVLNWLALAGLISGCNQNEDFAPPKTTSGTNVQYFAATGVVQQVELAKKTVTIKHQEVVGYMPAMTMPFDVKDTNLLRGLQMGDAVTFRLVVAGDDAWVDEVKKQTNAPAAPSTAKPAWRVVQDVELLNVGDPLPDYHFTNELGQAMSTGQFKGQALAFTFFFTRCPYPTFCPLMSKNFAEVQEKLESMTNAPANWHLLSISFDPENDTPETLKTYATVYHNDPARWNFLTGDLTDLTAIADQVGEDFYREGPSITHNLRTVVIDANGRVQKILPDNKWTPDELVGEMLRAARVEKAVVK